MCTEDEMIRCGLDRATRLEKPDFYMREIVEAPQLGDEKKDFADANQGIITSAQCTAYVNLKGG
jgi:hypothetical protein